MSVPSAEPSTRGSIQTQAMPVLTTADIEALDLSMIKLKLQDAEEGPGWDSETCDAVELEYKRFLALKRAYPECEIVPNRAVDAFWHQHILDTEKYAADCDALFGAFLHHFPYFGMRGEQDYADLCQAFSDTQHLYERHFGAMVDPGRSTKCRTKCKPVKCK